MGAVFQPETVRIFSAGFLSTRGTLQREPAGNHEKIIRKSFRPEYCFHEITEITRNRRFWAGLFDLARVRFHIQAKEFIIRRYFSKNFMILLSI